MALLTFLTSGGVQPRHGMDHQLLPAGRSSDLYLDRHQYPGRVQLGEPQPGAKTALDPSLPVGSSPVLDYLRGDQSQELRFAGGRFRSRTGTILGDIVSIRPRFIQKGPTLATRGNRRGRSCCLLRRTGSRYHDDSPPTNALAYSARVFGANDGMLRVLNAQCRQATSGREFFRLCSPLAILHSERVDVSLRMRTGSMSTARSLRATSLHRQHPNANAWKTIAIGTTGAGAAGMFAIDVTSSGDFARRRMCCGTSFRPNIPTRWSSAIWATCCSRASSVASRT